MSADERHAIRVDATQLLADLRRVEVQLRVDLDEPSVLSEWTTVCSQIKAAERELTPHLPADTNADEQGRDGDARAPRAHQRRHDADGHPEAGQGSA